MLFDVAVVVVNIGAVAADDANVGLLMLRLCADGGVAAAVVDGAIVDTVRC